MFSIIEYGSSGIDELFVEMPTTTNPKNIEHSDKINSIFLNRINSFSYLFSSITLPLLFINI